MINDKSPYQVSLETFNYRDEIKKLGLILDAQDGPVARSYVVEKLCMMLTESPIPLDSEKAERFNRWKRGPERLQ
jgi:hypothetical protein